MQQSCRLRARQQSHPPIQLPNSINSNTVFKRLQLNKVARLDEKSDMQQSNATSVLDNKVNRLFNYPLTIRQQVWLHYLAPGLAQCIIYTLNFILDLGVALALANRHIVPALATLCLMYMPAAILYLRQIAQPPAQNDFKTRAIWISKETGYLVFFPLRLIRHWGAKLFWLIEIFRHDDNNEDNLRNYDASSGEPALTYMFAMVFLQNIPQAILQIYLLARGTTKSTSINIIQCACALVSLLLGSIGAATYHRYTSQLVAGGRAPVWPTENRHTTTVCHQSQPLVPTQQTNKCWQKGLQNDTPSGKCLLILFWTLFLLGRTLVIGIMLRFYPKIVLLILSLHVVLFLLYYSTYSTIGIFNKIFLACTAVVVIVEVGIKFQKTVYLYMLFVISSVVEDVGFTIVWYVWGGWSRQWFNHAAYVIINCHLLALIVFAYYMAFEKPRTVYVRYRRS